MQNSNFLFDRCGTNCWNGCKEDCYWYGEWQDMGAHIPYCKCKSVDFIEPQDCNNCEQYHSKYKPTNADRIRSMSDEELAEWMAINTDCFLCKVKNKNICSLNEGTCTEEWLSWLKAPVEETEE